MLAPLLLGRGFALVGDMSFVPFQPWKGEWLGLEGGPPRAVPADAVVSILTHAVPGDLVQKAILLGSLLLAGFGMLRLLGALPWPARLGGAVLYVWNPYVYERLAIGHWGLLVGYAALPWVLRAAATVRREGIGALPSLLLWLALAATGSPTGGLLAAATAVIIVVGTSTGSWLAVVGSALLVNLPWIVPGFLQTHPTSDPAGVEAFAASPDSPWGLWGSLLGAGGIWKQSVAPDERSTWLLSGLAALIGLLTLARLWVRGRCTEENETLTADPRRLFWLGSGSLILAGLPGTRFGSGLVAFLVEVLPGAGLLRDSQKLLMPFVLVACVGFGLLIAAVGRRLTGDGRTAAPLLLAVFPILLLPTMGWGLSGRLEPVRYPAEWTTVRTVLEDSGAADDRMVVLPWSLYRAFEWNDHRAALDPAIRFFPGRVITAQDLVLDRQTVAGDDPLAAEVEHALAAGEPLGAILRARDVRWLLVEKGRTAPEVTIPDASVRHDGSDLRLLEVPGVHAPSGTSGWAVVAVAADALAACGVLVAALLLARRRLRQRSRQST